jgi:hypothetical protein
VSPFQFFAMAVASVVALALMLGLREMREQLERAQVAATVRNLNSALQFQIAHRIAAGREVQVAQLAGANPVPWLTAPPPGYAGEVAVLPAHIDAGTWLFDRSRGELVYRPVLHRHLSGAGSPPLLKWRIRRAAPPPRLLLTGGLSLAAEVAYRWD